MAKSYKRGADYVLSYNTGTRGSPTWVTIKGATNFGSDNDPEDVEVKEQGMGTGHLNGENDPKFTFTLYEDTGDTNVETLIAAIYSGVMVELALSRGPIALTGTKYLRLEALLRAPLGADRPDASSYDVTAYRHANSDYDLTRSTAA